MQMSKSSHFDKAAQAGAPSIRMPELRDGTKVWALIEASGALDGNSLYCNLLQCSHFAATCALAEKDGEILGWMSGYTLPERPDTLFVWQVCVAEAARGQGLGRKLIAAVLERPGCADVRHVECTITKANAPSWALFRKVAQGLDADLTSQPQFLREAHLNGQHDSEIRVTIGPFDRHDVPQAQSA
jgi:L-2,4-diaminobutyric acid acetyltransferase